jgi:hypothetical protein
LAEATGWSPTMVSTMVAYCYQSSTCDSRRNQLSYSARIRETKTWQSEAGNSMRTTAANRAGAFPVVYSLLSDPTIGDAKFHCAGNRTPEHLTRKPWQSAAFSASSSSLNVWYRATRYAGGMTGVGRRWIYEKSNSFP